MSLRLEMLQVARLSRKQLGDAAELVVQFLLSQMNEDGGFKDREGKSDLYYTVFGVESLVALSADVPAPVVAAYLDSFGGGESLDFVHLACLARCWASMPRDMLETVPRERILQRIEAHRSAEGGYNTAPNATRGTVYGCFLALGSYQDLRQEMPERQGILTCIRQLEAGDGGYANQHDMPVGLTAATAAAVTLLRHLGQPVRQGLGEWLLSRCHREGGFFPTPQAPIPDLLSTATALHALSGMQVSLERIKEPCLDFIDSLWTNRGSFYGNWNDDTLDCEYTYYALLALGHLSL